jgi:hypothetical protein
LNNKKLQALEQLLQEKLEHKHIEPSFSPWNSQVIQKNGEINWFHPSLGIPNYKFTNCFLP